MISTEEDNAVYGASLVIGDLLTRSSLPVPIVGIRFSPQGNRRTRIGQADRAVQFALVPGADMASLGTADAVF